MLQVIEFSFEGNDVDEVNKWLSSNKNSIKDVKYNSSLCVGLDGVVRTCSSVLILYEESSTKLYENEMTNLINDTSTEDPWKDTQK